MGSGNFRIYSGLAGGHLAKIKAFLPDRPGSLAELASRFARFGINIVFFHYNRSEHPNRVLLEVECRDEGPLLEARAGLEGQGFLEEPPLPSGMELGIMDTGSLLKVEARLENRPGALGRFAAVLRDHGANVIHMDYNEDVSGDSAGISLVTSDPGEVDRLLRDLTEHGYYYSIAYRGLGQREVEEVIGLNLVERFFFRLKGLLATEDIDRLKRIVDSSTSISQTLVRFSSEAGKHFEAGEVFTRVLAFASASLMKTGEDFSARRLEPASSGRVTLHAFRLPTGGNIHVLEAREECVMVDCGYGLYYDDVKRMLRDAGLEPSRIRRIYLSHADADHAGMSGYFAGEFGATVHLHRDAAGVIANEDRSWGSGFELSGLNHYFTRLVDEFTSSRPPREWVVYGREEKMRLGGFSVVDAFEIGGQTYQVIESLGGHVPGQVFFFSYESGLFFTADYLLLVESLSPEERETLNVPRFLMTSTNVDSALFREEMEALRTLALGLDHRLRPEGKRVLVVPGHGDYYPAERLR
jgi:glyoxylase-like metal-dependent hydrolase (beta-lactamase superfamily II)